MDTTTIVAVYWLYVNGALVVTPQGYYPGPYTMERQVCEKVFIERAKVAYPPGTTFACVPHPYAVPRQR